MDLLTGQRIIVTGAGRGLGRAYAIAVAAAGGRVVVNDIDAAEAEAVCRTIASRGGDAVVSSHSVSDPVAAAAMINLCVERFGGLDGLINNAGVFYMTDPAQEDTGEAHRLIEVNVMGVLNCGLCAIRRMSAQGHGVIINVTSGASLGSLAHMATYGASKGAVVALTRSWALDLEKSGVHVVAVSPVAQTRLTPQLGAKIAGGRSPDDTQPEAIAPLIICLLAGGAAALNGAVIRLANGELSLLEPAKFGPPLGSSSRWDATSIASSLGVELVKFSAATGSA